MFQKIYSSLVVCFALVGCNNYEFPESPYATVTKVAATLSANGVSLEAQTRTHGDLSVVRHGFVWATRENLAIETDDHIDFGASEKPGSFRYIISEGLETNTRYYVKAFVFDGKNLVYSEVTEFTR